MFTELFKKILTPIHPCAVEEVRHHTQKEARIIDTLEPMMNQHRLIVDRKIIEKDYKQYSSDKDFMFRLFFQMTRMTRDKGAVLKDDAIDCLAIGVAYWVEQMSLDQEERERERRDTFLEKLHDDFMENHQLSTPKRDSWIK